MYLNISVLKIFVLILISLNINSITANKYNVSLVDMATCKEYDVHGTRGYMYSDFFEVHKLDNKKWASNERLHLKFYVVTAMDAHILLSVTDRPRLQDRVYEIVLGAGSNTFSTIRTNMGKRRVATNQDPQLLSVFDPTPIEIIQKYDGDLLVYVPGYKEEPLLNYTDPAPLNINYISFSTFGSSTAKWYYDCKFDGYETEIEQEKRFVSPENRLLEHINSKAQEVEGAPNDLTTVNFGLEVRAVSFNNDASILKTRLNLIFYWQQEDLQWQPADYNNIEAIVRPTMDIWIPRIMVVNGAYAKHVDLDFKQQIRVDFNGSISLLATNIEISSWCTNAAKNWPQDAVPCYLHLTIDDDKPLALNYDANSSLSKEPISTLSEWRLRAIGVQSISNKKRFRLNVEARMELTHGDVSLEFFIVRNSNFYKDVFSMPVLAAQTLIMLSFLLRGYRRGALILVVFIIIAMGLMFITKHAPPAYVPNIMIAYQHAMRMATFCYMLHIIIMWLEMYPPKAKPSGCVMAIVNCSPLRFLLCMRFSDSTEYVEIQENPWREISKILNKISFVVINVIFIITDVMLLPKSI